MAQVPRVTPREIFITGGTGYIGRRLIPILLERGHRVSALVRSASKAAPPAGCRIVEGNALEMASFAGKVAPADTFVQLVGVPHPSPSKAQAFRDVDLVSARASIAAAAEAGIRHFIYLSVAQPAPIMKAYLAVRAEGEALLRSHQLNATILRPWYVLGPGHRWPAALLPVYWILGRVPATRESAGRLGLVTLRQMLAALAGAVENPPTGIRILNVPDIRSARF